MVEHTEPVARGCGRGAPRSSAWRVHRLRRVGYRSGRVFPAARRDPRLARNRHAGRLRRRRGAGGPQAARRRAVHGRRTGRTGPSRCVRLRSTTPTARSSAPRWPRTAASRSFSASFRDDEAALDAAIREALAACDVVILSGGTSKGAGDLTYRLVARLGEPGIVAHGVALKPGKPLCLAVCGAKPVVVLPGFPTSAMFTFHDIVAPVLRRLAGLPPRAEAQVSGDVPLRVASELGRTEFVLVSLVEARGRARRLSDGQRLRLRDRLLPGRRLLHHRGARRARCRPGAEASVHAVHAARARRPISSSSAAIASALTPCVGRLPNAASRRRALRSAASAAWRRRGAANATSRRSTCSTRRPASTTRRS